MQYDPIQHTKDWIQDIVIGLNLCPFAQKPFVREKIRYVLVKETEEELLLKTLLAEAQFLKAVDLEEVETSILIHPNALLDFDSYLNFIHISEVLFQEMGFNGIIQLASFHPDYQFGDAAEGAVENYTNRSPFPMLHLLREDIVEKALENYPEPEQIPNRNIQTMNELGVQKIMNLLTNLSSNK